MSGIDVEVLFQPDVLRLIDQLESDPSPTSIVRTVEVLRKEGHPTEVIHQALEQVRLRRKAVTKFGEFAQQMLFSEDGLEQATRLVVAAHHAGRFLHAGYTHIADLGCGIGGDAMAFAAVGLEVLAVESDPTTAALASYNLQPLGVEVQVADAMSIDLAKYQAIWVDPARRKGGRRLNNPDDWSPGLAQVFALASRIASGIKLAPGMDRDLIPPGVEAQWVSVSGEVVELVLWSGALAREGIGRSALLLGGETSHELALATDSPDAEDGEIGTWIYEPDGAIIRARLIGEVARNIGGRMIDSSIAYITADHFTPTPFATAFRIERVMDLKRETIAQWVREENIGVLEIKKRGVDIDPAQFRRTLDLSGMAERTLILTRHRGKKIAIGASRQPSR